MRINANLARVATIHEGGRKIELSRDKLERLITNFDRNVCGQDVLVTIAEKQQHGSAGTVKRLYLAGDRLWAEVHLTQAGIDAIGIRGFRYFDAAIDGDYIDRGNGQHHGPTLRGAALTLRPRIKHLTGAELLGRVRLSNDFYTNGGRKMREAIRLQEAIDKRIGISGMTDSVRFRATGGRLPEANKRFAEKVLEKFDRENAPRLLSEEKKLAGGEGLVSDAAVPALFERTVIREALYRLRGLEFVDHNIDEEGNPRFASSIDVHYSYRDTTAAGPNNSRKYEGQEISRAGVIQAYETAYPIPQKLALELSDELRYLTSGQRINFEATRENTDNAARIIAEDLDAIIFNEILHASDEYTAVPVSNEVIADAATDGTNNIFPLANFPVVRPRKVYDLQGNQQGNTANPITVEYDSGGGYSAIQEYDGTGNQSAGTYYVIDYNLGELRLVDESGAIQTPGATHDIRVSYSYVSNVYAFDTDLGGETPKVHWDGYLYRYGLRKSLIEDERYHMADFGLMSGTHMTQVEQAEQFGANHKRPGTNLTETGDLGAIKDIPNWKAYGLGLWMGDQRAIIGQKGTTRLRMLKPWSVSDLIPQRGPNGRFTGKREAYGDQFVAVHTPTQLKRAYTSIALYSSSGRVARAA